MADEHDSGQLLTELQTIRATGGFLPGTREAVEVAGPDAATYLQGQLSQEVASLPQHQPVWSLILAPQGKVDVFVRVTRTGEETFVLDTDAGFSDAVIARLQRFLLRTRATVTALPWTSLAVRGPASGQVAETVSPAPNLVVAPVSWGSVAGVDLLGSADALAAAFSPADRPHEMSCEAFDLLRIEAGEPLMGAELDEDTIPAAAGIVERSVSFVKGCYTGQELVARMDSRGNNAPQRLVRLVVDGQPIDRSELADVKIYSAEDSEHAKAVGRVTSAQWSPEADATVALAYIGRAVADDASVQVSLAAKDGAEPRTMSARMLPLDASATSS